jgi:hypothetical protein
VFFSHNATFITLKGEINHVLTYFHDISLHGDAILKKLKIRLNACIIFLLLLYLIGVIFSVNLKFYGQNSCVNLIKEVNFSREFLIF